MPHHQDTSHDTGWNKKSLPSYLTGFTLAVLLTLISFSLVEFRLVNVITAYILLSLLALTQLIVHSVCFLRLTQSSAGKWNLFPFLFILLITAILAGGTLWIMYNLNYNMDILN